MNDREHIKVVTATLLIVGLAGLIIFQLLSTLPRNVKSLTRDEVCQKAFGKDYVFVNGNYSNDFCVNGSGIPKYPRTW